MFLTFLPPLIDSDVATELPAVTVQPSSVSTYETLTATFSVTATGGGLSYQWETSPDEVTWTALSGETASSVTLENLSRASQNGLKISCVITNTLGSVRSNAATLTVQWANDYQVRGFTDSNYFQATSDVGVTSLGTLRCIFKLLDLPASGQRIIVGRVGASGAGIGGWYLTTGYNGSANAADVIGVAHRNNASTTPTFTPVFTFVAGDVGKHFVLHATCTDSKCRLYIGGVEVGSGTTPAGALIAAPTTARTTIGRFQHATSLSNPHVALVHYAVTATVLSAADIFADALAIQAETSNLQIPTLTSETERFDADAIASETNWVATTGGFTLTRNGSLTVEQF